ncbi:MAG TPA: hypothetical protein VFX98_06975 [Longimicrobiaceae bacterium]|nr:hypothetical protein [Longimicrobiaceae bacterium]
MRFFPAAALCLALAAALPAAAQQRTAPFPSLPPVAIPVAAQVVVVRLDTLPEWEDEDKRLAYRAALGTLGWAVGGAVGALLGVQIEGDVGEGEYGSLAGFVLGGLAGAAIGGAAAAAAPELGSRCDYGERAARGVLGGLGGGLLIGLGAFADPRILFLIPVGMIGGTTLASDCG